VATRQRSTRASRTAAGATATGEPSCDTVVATGPQQEEASTSAVVTSRVLIPRTPYQGRRQALPECRPVGDREAPGDVADDDAP
jgi:hypothetical protein